MAVAIVLPSDALHRWASAAVTAAAVSVLAELDVQVRPGARLPSPCKRPIVLTRCVDAARFLGHLCREETVGQELRGRLPPVGLPPAAGPPPIPRAGPRGGRGPLSGTRPLSAEEARGRRRGGRGG
ncbi:unnamed protein product [Prorocentrum cordatum]|uniref:Secreted protein n=1 Tax=Prorocentrum cordatum TaxID=2364126 RepID=A0ABN9Y890_9DINO|nr:unnamed protein product [Polarella glacialis]